MSPAVLSRSVPPAPAGASGVRPVVALVLGAWFATIAFLGARRAFDGPPGAPPLALVAAVLLPLLAFAAALALSRAFRAWAMALDPRLTTALQAWRFAGFGFLALYANGVLPGGFALPAGLGDMAIAVAAPWILARLLRSPAFAASRAYVAWNVLGIVDLLCAVGAGGLAAMLATGAPGEITSAPMAHLPLLLIPAWGVPVFLMLHVVALLQARRLARAAA